MLYVNWEKADFIKPCVQECSIFFKLKPLQFNLKLLTLILERKENHEVNYEDR